MFQVQVSEGILEGEVKNNEYGGKIYSFKGIPYAQPPVGDLRFKAPQPPKPWNGVREAKTCGNDCYQSDLITGMEPHGSEDCLYLNVYSPNITPAKPLPVMVWIHGGGFTSGSGSDVTYAPNFLIRQDVILVTLNYRLEILGFLCLETEDVPGNAGLKDQVAALRWVKKNISSFGGDPDNVTIFGESAGGACVSLHLISLMSKGLFKRAISQSGNAACYWATSFMAKERSLAVAKEMGCNSKDEKEIYEFFKSQPVEALINKRVPLFYAEANKEFPQFFFSAVSEKEFGDNERFLHGEPVDILRNGIHEGVEVINGYTEDEGVLMLGVGVNINNMFSQANKFYEYFVPRPFALACIVTEQMKIGRLIKEFYFNGEDVSIKNVDKLYKYLGADGFSYPAVLWQKICSSSCKNKTYLYKFTCKSERNVFKYLLGVADIVGEKNVVSHADDLPYLFPIAVNEEKVQMNSPTFKMIDQVTRLWTNFAKYGNPTPDCDQGVTWKPYSLEKQAFLDIGEQLVPGTAPDKEIMEFWENMYKEYCPKYAP
ncbi:unnamed protein product [Parnassius apollo]|uniref:Carboxylic ester hydrolase n=1 Tax=Parnassius apollo TaxID=110799 RepID=A0A8S3W1I2_PARAO|nr:unnamed protein product [Parnassius apollo]